jgi:hypothetical protein
MMPAVRIMYLCVWSKTVFMSHPSFCDELKKVVPFEAQAVDFTHVCDASFLCAKKSVL